MTATGPPQFQPSHRLGDVPNAFWAGGVIALIGFVVHLSEKRIVASGDLYSCTYHDYAAFVAAGAIVACIAAGWSGRRQLHIARRLATPLMVGISLVLAALAIWHVLRGMGTVGSPCDNHPLP